MKLAMITLILVPTLGWATVSDFNALIDENAKVQGELQQNIQAKDAAASVRPSAGSIPMVVKSETYNVPSTKNALKFKKEMHENRPSQKQDLERLAEELKSLDNQF